MCTPESQSPAPALAITPRVGLAGHRRKRPRFIPPAQGTEGGKGGIMDGRYPHGLLLAITNCTDPSKEEAFNAWDNHTHVPDVTAPGIFRHALRFVNTDSSAAAGQYVATYETNWEDVTQAMPAHREASVQLRERGDRGTPYLQVVRSGVFQRLGGEFCAASRPTRGILLVLSNCTDPAREAAFNRWYEDIHVADILETGAFHTAYRYESLDPQATKTKYLALYETEQSDPAKAREAMRKARADWEKRGRLSDTIEVVASLTARRLWPLD